MRHLENYHTAINSYVDTRTYFENENGEGGQELLIKNYSLACLSFVMGDWLREVLISKIYQWNYTLLNA